VVLHFMTHAVAERQVFAHAIIVLHVPAKLILAILHCRIAEPLCVLRGQCELERRPVRELKSAKPDRRLVTRLGIGVTLQPETDAVLVARVINVVDEFKLELTTTARSLRAAVVESTGNENRLTFAD